MLTDTHCHLDLERFDADRPEVLQRARAVGVSRILIPALDLESCRRVLKMVQTDALLFAAIGIHPTEAGKLPENWLNQLAALLPGAGKLVAIGEIGLDYYWDSAPHELQREVLRAQLTLAAQAQLPVLIHLREKEDALQGEAAADLLEILQEWAAALRREKNPLAECPGVLHSFSGSLATAQRALALNFHLGITGPLTFKNAEARREVVKSLPLERLLIETDSPFLAPVPQRGKRNEPAFVCHIADKIAEIHLLPPQKVADITSENARRLFAWG